MDKTVVQSTRRVDALDPQAGALKTSRADGAVTRARILDAARRCLCEQGYAKLNVRDIARDAGVNHALIGYHFRGKRQLVLAVLDEANQELLERQKRMYDQAMSAEEKWRQAREFYEQDLESGFVRLLMELMGASFHDEALRLEFVPRLLSWQRVVEKAVSEYIESAGLDLPVSARAIAGGVTWFWIGMEASMTAGVTEEQGHYREALDAVATLLRRTSSGSAPPVSVARSGRRKK